jgi:FHA domain-containing protein
VGTHHESVRPFDVVARAHSVTREEFVAGYGADKLLLVSLADQPDCLLDGLLACTTGRARPRRKQSDSNDDPTRFEDVEDTSQIHISTSPPPSGSKLPQLLAHPQFVVTLRKRGAEPTLANERITVGRSSRNDIVLYHPTVSKQHAWLEYDARRRVLVCDASSANLTSLGGKILDPNVPVQCPYGEEICFGGVIARIFLPGALWDALQAED